MKSEVRNAKSGLKTLVCFALKEEAAPFRKLSAGRPGVSILVSGIGRANAEKSLQAFLEEHAVARVFTCGFAGGLNPDLALGAVVFETDVAVLREKLIAAEAKPAKFHSVPRIVTTAAEKRELRRVTGADAVEMESEAIHALCHKRGIPCATVRVITDTASEDLPLDFNQLTKSDLSLDYGKLALAVAKSPGKIGTLRRLQKQTQFAAERLGEALAKVIWPA